MSDLAWYCQCSNCKLTRAERALQSTKNDKKHFEETIRLLREEVWPDYKQIVKSPTNLDKPNLIVSTVDSFICPGCNESAKDEDLTELLNEFTWAEGTGTVVVLWWHRGCYLRCVADATKARGE
jgi:hypothetical protein